MGHLFSEQLGQMRQYFHTSVTLGHSFRKEKLLRLKRSILNQEQDIYNSLYSDLKKNPEEVWATETGLLLQEINYTVKNLYKWMKPEKAATNLLNFPSTSYIYPSPKGVVLVIGTWNFPLMLTLIPLVGAIAAGNCVVVKPSEHAPATAALIQKIIEETFSPEHVYAVQGDGGEVIPPMMDSFRFDHVFFTGGIAVGKKIYEAAAKQLTPVTLELGGKSPCVIENDADLEVAARRITVGKFANAGQLCVAPDYLLVHEEVKEKLVSLINKNIQKFYGPDPSQDYNYGKIINEKQFDRLTGYLKQGRILSGGRYDKTKLFIEPTLIDDVSFNDPLMKEEIFGPVLPVLSYKTKSEALKIIGQNPFPLSFYVFTGSKKNAKEWMQELQFGNGCINNTAWQFTNHHLPFGGIGNSGLGGYHGKHTFDVFTHYKGVMKTPTWFDPAIKYPPFKGKLKLFKRIIK